jgi:hypothetical protein
MLPAMYALGRRLKGEEKIFTWNGITILSKFREDESNTPVEILDGKDLKKDLNIQLMAFYFPQYHQIPENDAAWGLGFTDWDNLRVAKPLLQNQVIRTPATSVGFYDPCELNVRQRQRQNAEICDLGFIYYHYWFSGKWVMPEVTQALLRDGEPNVPFMLAWANEPWSRKWDGSDNDTFLPQNYGEEADWKQHFQVLIQFWKHPMYVKVEGRPVFVIYRPFHMPENTLTEMSGFWKKECVRAGIKEVMILEMLTNFDEKGTFENAHVLEGAIEFPPGYLSRIHGLNPKDNEKQLELLPSFYNEFRETEYLRNNPDVRIAVEKGDILNAECHYNNIGPEERLSRILPTLYMDIHERWDKMLTLERTMPLHMRGIHVGWDTTSRALGRRAAISSPSTAEEFGMALFAVFCKVAFDPNEKLNLVVVNAFNEWAEQATLEPDNYENDLRLQRSAHSLVL